MDALRAAFLGVGVLMALTLLGWLRMKWNDLEREYQRNVGWHRMWTERIERNDNEQQG